MHSNLQILRQQLRHRLRAQRVTRSEEQAVTAAQICCEILISHKIFRSARHIAGYMAIERELDPMSFLRAACAAGKSVYLPRITGKREMEFLPWQPGAMLRENSFGIPEPVSDRRARRDPRDLDLVLVPLLGFDQNGNRLGFGGGFYDKAFAFRNARQAPPLLCGYAYADQRCEAIEVANWDVSLDAVVTPEGIEIFSDSEAGTCSIG